ncbi:hypothetical protein C1701_11610 [Actinoalloteichus sp. AHMU CJ021]|uniref:Uncharacterized protein n=1 Tax=Actinoalloteichus caeruleus DSM 43889 TaxID=1120930 RepID=A0ABT1JKQ8_ACTCY|nr:hypothetical protein C1701_11610 [Actinoalloteichus sp. AHMU CJ021]MCP2333099.1 hypothetical protein [Actinoalloteichus caeruleus DSM 43889]
MVDEQRIAGLFREAAGAETPPASFDEGDVARESHRITRRRRMTAAGGSVFAVALLAGGISVVGTTPWQNDGGGETVAGPLANGQADAPEQGPAVMGQPLEDQESRAEAEDLPGTMRDEAEPEQPTDLPVPELEPGSPPAVEPVPTGCGAVDPQLAAALAEALPDDAEEPGPVDAACVPDSRGASAQVEDDGNLGTVSVVLGPPDVPAPVVETSPDGESHSTLAEGGGVLTVVSEPATRDAEPPFVNRLAVLGERLADQF